MAKEEVEELSSEDIYNAKQKQTDISKCPTCGANLIFNPEKQCLSCEYCATEKKVITDKSVEISFEKLFETNNNTWSNETHVFRCTNCGAKEVISKKDIALSCSFCGTTNVVETDELSGLKPNAVIPFKITREVASEKVIFWARKKFFAPKDFKKSARPEEIKGVYNPTFTFDAYTFSHYKGRLGRYKVYTRTVNGRQVTERKLEYFNISGTYNTSFDDILIQASSNIDQKYINRLQPFDTNNSNEYSTEYLHGFNASQYTKDGKACWNDAKNVIDNRLRMSILSGYNYDVVDRFDCQTSYQNITYKYLLLPIYVGHCIYHAKLYNFYVNGINTKVTGKTPVSVLKVSIAVIIGLIILAAIFVIFYFVGMRNSNEFNF